MSSELLALLNGREIGRVHRDKQGRLSFVYAPAWRQDPDAYPLSLSMPLAAAEHGRAAIEAFLWGLLPDNEAILEGWARRFHVSARNPLALLSEVGEDCPGAVQFVRPERLDVCLTAEPEPIEWLDEHAVAERLRALRADPSAWRLPSDTGQFSLAGAQPKTALLLDDGRWGVPSGRTPTTHILKPPGELAGQAENEHFCLVLARQLGLPTTSSTIRRFEDQIAIVVERYDRQRTKDGILRVHQEDLCQAMGVSPTRKYENEGGPGVTPIIAFLRDSSTEREQDVSTFVDALIFNWLVAGTDAHAKNFSLLIATGRVRLAPLYDLASILPYDLDFQKIKLAMKIGSDYKLRDIGQREWRQLAEKNRLDPDQLLDRIREFAARIPDEAAVVRDRMRDEGLHHGVIDRLCDRLSKRAAESKQIMELRP